MSNDNGQRLAALYPDHETALDARHRFEEAGFPAGRVRLLEPGGRFEDEPPAPGSTATRDEVIANTTAGTATGGAAGAAGAVGIGLAAPALYVAAPVVGPLMVLGYGALIGGTAGALSGLRVKDDEMDSVIKDALGDGYYVLEITAADASERERADRLLDETVRSARVQPDPLAGRGEE